MRGKTLFSIGLLASGLSFCQPVFAETREECRSKVHDKTNAAVGAAGGGLAGKIIGASACGGFLGMALADFGLSFAACVVASTTLGGLAGTYMGESVSKEQLRQCDKLPE